MLVCKWLMHIEIIVCNILRISFVMHFRLRNKSKIQLKIFDSFKNCLKNIGQ